MLRLQLGYAVRTVAPYLPNDTKLVKRMQRLATGRRATATASASVHTAPHSSDSVAGGLLLVPRDREPTSK